MQGINAYRNSVYTMPLHMQISQLHRQAGVFTRMVAQHIDAGDIPSARQNIQYVQDIIAFVRSSLDMTLEVSSVTDATYEFYYNILVRWFVEPETYAQDYESVLEFWDSWADTWSQVSVQ